MRNALKAEYSALLATKVWTKTDIARVTKALNSMRFGDNAARKEFLTGWYNQFQDGPTEFRISPDHAAQGLEYFMKYCFKKDGGIRKGCKLERFELDCIRLFESFRFVGWFELSNPYGDIQYLIVFRVYARNGQWFDYSPCHWHDPMVHGSGVDPVRATKYAVSGARKSPQAFANAKIGPVATLERSRLKLVSKA